MIRAWEKRSWRILQSAGHEPAFVFWLGADVNGLDEVHIQHAPLEESDGLTVLGLQLTAGAPFSLGLAHSLQLLAPKHMIRQLQQPTRQLAVSSTTLHGLLLDPLLQNSDNA